MTSSMYSRFSAACLAAVLAGAGCGTPPSPAPGPRPGLEVAVPIPSTSAGPEVGSPTPAPPVSLPGGQVIELVRLDSYSFQLATDGEFIYWADYVNSKGLWRAPVSGGARQQIATVNPYAQGVAVSRSHVYFTADSQADGLGGPRRLFRVGKSGGPVETVADGVMPEKLASDGDRVFWLARDGLYSIGATGPAALIAPVHGSRVTFDRGELFYQRDNAIYRISKSGGAETRVATTENLFRGMALDATHVYWTESGLLEMPPSRSCPPGVPCPIASAVPRMPNGVVKAVPRAGGAVVTLATKQDTIDEVGEHGDHVYWAMSDALRRILKKGGSPEVVTPIKGSPNPMVFTGGFVFFEAGGFLRDRSVP